MMILLVILDQLSKYFAFQYKPDFDVIGNFLRIHYIENTGTIFGLLENSNFIFMILAIILCIIIAIYMKLKVPKRSFKEKCFMIILTGGIGNLIDRIFRGYVVDFISLKYVGVFNFADMYIVIGVILLVILEIREIIKNGEASKKSDFNT